MFLAGCRLLTLKAAGCVREYGTAPSSAARRTWGFGWAVNETSFTHHS